MRTFYLGAASALLLSPLSSLAADSTTDEIVVTATRTAQTADASLASVSVITRTDIERSQASSVAELLTGEIGVDSAVNGGYGKTTSLFVRGTNTEHVLVLIDGMRVGSATLGSFSFEFVPLDEVERIEIVRGPRSSLYGSEAIGGVIQIFTRKGKGKFNAEANAGSGSYRTGQTGAGVSGDVAGTYYSVHASRFNTRGFDAQQNNTPTTGNEPDKDGYLNTAYTLRLGHRFGNNADLSATLLNAAGNTEYDGYFDKTDFLQRVGGVKFAFSPLSAWRVSLNVGQNRDNTSNFKSAVFQSLYNTRRRLASWQNDISLGNQQLFTLGADYQKDYVSSSSSYAEDSRKDVGAFGQYQASFGAVDTSLSLRSDNDQAFGRRTTGNSAIGYNATDKLRLTVSYGTAFKAPTFNGLYWPYTVEVYAPNTYITQGNPNLRPEESQSSELGLVYKASARTQLHVNVFRTRIHNLIEWVSGQPGPNTFTYIPENIASARIEGFETRLDTHLLGLDTRVNYTWVDPRDLDTNKILARRARNTFKLQLDRRFGKISAGADWLVQTGRYDDAANLNKLGGYALVGSHAQYDFAPHWWLRAKIDNLFNKQYETVKTYNSAGRNLFVSVGTEWR